MKHSTKIGRISDYSHDEILLAAGISKSERHFRIKYRWAFLAALRKGDEFFQQVLASIPAQKGRNTANVMGPKPISALIKKKLVKERLNKRLEIGKFFRSKRTAAGILIDEISKELGCCHQNVSNWERGVSLPPLKHLKAICEVYRIGNKEEVLRLYVGLYENEVRSVLF